LKVTSEEIKLLSRLVRDLCGVVIDESKDYLIEQRLTPIADEYGCKSFSELYHKIRYAKDRNLEQKIIDAITTQETLFFRDTSPYEALQYKALPELIDAKEKQVVGKNRIRIWSAACSTGQEPYSIAMIICELLPDVHENWDVQILATDISDDAIKQASRGEYTDYEIGRGMKEEMLKKYFIRTPKGWKVKDELRSLIAFRKLNLLKPFVGIGPFDVIFCRNVAIYFEPEIRKDLFKRITDVLTPEGYLFVGSSESLIDLGPNFKPLYHCRAVFYRPNKLAAELATSK